MTKGPSVTPLSERFWAKVPDQPGMDCWIWQGAKSLRGRASPEGYGTIGAGSMYDGTRRNIAAHRVAYELCCGSIPKGKFVLHACDNPPCVNPNHLFLGDNAANMQDASRKGRLGGFAGAAMRAPPKTHCPYGHAYTPENVYARSDGRRHCRTCKREADRRRAA